MMGFFQHLIHGVKQKSSDDSRKTEMGMQMKSLMGISKDEKDLVTDWSEDEISFLALHCQSESKTEDLVKLNGPSI